MKNSIHVMTKMIGLIGLFAAIIVSLIGLSLWQSRNIMMENRKMAIRQIVETMRSTADHYHKLSENGYLTEKEAKETVKSIIRAARYGHGDYLFVYNTNGVTEVHGTRPEIEGQQRLNVKDADGKPFVREQIEVALSGGGYVTYRYIKPGYGHELFPKITYDKLYEPWNWVIATGVYFDDINDAFLENLKKWGLATTALLTVLVLITYYIGKTISAPITDLAAAKEQAETATKAKSDFLANMSHEIRTPLNGVLGMIALIMSTKMTNQQREWAEIAHQSAEELLTLINDILDISKVEAGHLVLEEISFDLHTTFCSITDLLYVRARKKGVELLVRLSPTLPRHVIGDPARLRQIILNLVGNSIKFTSQGHIILSGDAWEDKGNLVIRLAVEDTGIGIPPEKISTIFDKFSQAESSTSRKYGGTGLGLAICKNLVELMGGEIGVQSSLGHGSIFWMTAHLSMGQGTENAQQDPADFCNSRTLVVASNTVARDIYHGYLNSWHLENNAAISVVGAMDSLKQALAEKNPYHFVLIDSDLPNKESSSLVEQIAALHSTLCEPFIILCSSPDEPFDAEDMKSKKVCGILSKPVYPSQLHDMLIHVWEARKQGLPPDLYTRHTLGRTSMEAESPLSLEMPDPSSIHILLVEDRPVNQILMKTILERAGCTVTVANNGIEAIAAVKNSNFNMIFMDCHMPEMDGFEATKGIRKFEAEGEKKRYTPIVALTADAMKGDRDRCLAAGMDDYVNKPVKAATIMSMINKYGNKNITA